MITPQSVPTPAPYPMPIPDPKDYEEVKDFQFISEMIDWLESQGVTVNAPEHS